MVCDRSSPPRRVAPPRDGEVAGRRPDGGGPEPGTPPPPPASLGPLPVPGRISSKSTPVISVSPISNSKGSSSISPRLPVTVAASPASLAGADGRQPDGLTVIGRPPSARL